MVGSSPWHRHRATHPLATKTRWRSRKGTAPISKERAKNKTGKLSARGKYSGGGLGRPRRGKQRRPAANDRTRTTFAKDVRRAVASQCVAVVVAEPRTAMAGGAGTGQFASIRVPLPNATRHGRDPGYPEDTTRRLSRWSAGVSTPQDQPIHHRC